MRAIRRTDAIIHFFYNDYVGSEMRYFVYIGKFADGTRLDGSFANALPEEIARCLAEHGVCAECGARVSIFLDPCPCGILPNEGGHLRVAIVNRSSMPTLHDLLGREFERVRSANRKRRMRAAKTTLTDSEVSLLLSLQRGLCFYCGEEFPFGDSGPMYHRDHYQALVAGGETTLENTVLACSLCNARKGATNGWTFSQISSRVRRSEVKARYAAMRRYFRVGLKKYLNASTAE